MQIRLVALCTQGLLLVETSSNNLCSFFYIIVDLPLSLALKAGVRSFLLERNCYSLISGSTSKNIHNFSFP